jgi:hypothetical protein
MSQKHGGSKKASPSFNNSKREHVTVQIEGGHEERPAPENSEQITDNGKRETKKSSKTVGGIVGRWKNLLSKPSKNSEVISKTKTKDKSVRDKVSERTEDALNTMDIKEDSLPTSKLKPKKKVKSLKDGRQKAITDEKEYKITTKANEHSTTMSQDDDEIQILSEAENTSDDDSQQTSIRSFKDELEKARREPMKNNRSSKESKNVKSKSEVKADLLKEKFKAMKSKVREKVKKSPEHLVHFEKTKALTAEEEKAHEKTIKAQKLSSRWQANTPTKLDSINRDLLLGITIHSSDMLPLDPNIIHPVVKVTVMKQDGSMFRKSDELKNESTEHTKSDAERKSERKRRRKREVKSSEDSAQTNPLSPIMTQPFRMTMRNPTFCPTWNELLLYDEPFRKFIQQESNAIVFFEIMDFLPMTQGAEAPTSGFHGRLILTGSLLVFVCIIWIFVQ